MNQKFKAKQHVYFLICGRYVTQASVITANSWFVTICFRKYEEDCIIRLPQNRIFTTEEEARRHIRPALPPIRQPAKAKNENGEYVSTRRWELWE